MKPEDRKRFMENAAEAAHLMKMLSNVNRLMILCALTEGELSVATLNESVPLSQSALSQHLAVLRGAELVSTRKEGTVVYYALQGDAAFQVMTVLKRLYCS